MRKLEGAGLLFASLLVLTILLAFPPAGALLTAGDTYIVYEIPGSGNIAIDDFNGDGIDDIVATSYSNNAVYAYLSNPFGMPLSPTTKLFAMRPTEIVTGDINDDDVPDLIVLGENRVYVFEKLVSDQFSLLAVLFTNQASDIGVGDSGGNNLNDIFVVGPFGTRVYFQDPMIPGRFDQLRRMDIISAPGDSISVVRIDDDDMVDFAVFTPYYVLVHLQTAPNGYEISSTVMLDAEDYNPEYASTGDTDGDGRVDLVIPRPDFEMGGTGALKVLFSDATYQFSLANALDIEGPISTSSLVDFEGDGTSEILVSLVGGDVNVIDQSSGFELSGDPFIPMSYPEGIVVLSSGNFNQDSLADVVVRVVGFAYVFLVEDCVVDLPVSLRTPIPSTFHLNEGQSVSHLIDLSAYFYDDFGSISYTLVYEEDSSSLDADLNGHFLDFQASPDWSGSLRFQVEAWDGNPDNSPARSNVFSVWVNDAPRIVSVAPSAAEIGGEYSYQIIVEDDYPAWDRVNYKLASGSQGMSIDETGLLTWTPEDSGQTRVQIEVRDVFGLSDVQTFVVEVPLLPPPPPIVPPETPYFVGAVVTSLSAVAVAALISENIKFALLLFFVPLYTKIRRERVLDHFIRGQIYGYILANPGEHYNAIKQALGLTNGSLAHHLKTLEREEFIKSRKFGLYRRFYPKHMRIPEDGDFRMNAVQRHIVDVIDEHPGITQKEIASEMNITPPTVNYHIGILASAKMIRVIREGRRTMCFVESN